MKKEINEPKNKYSNDEEVEVKKKKELKKKNK